jgi:hypothetical protein
VPTCCCSELWCGQNFVLSCRWVCVRYVWCSLLDTPGTVAPNHPPPSPDLCSLGTDGGVKQTTNSKKLWEELIAYLYLIRHEPHRKRRSQQFFYWYVAAVTFLPNHFLATIRGIHIETHRLMGGIYEVRR